MTNDGAFANAVAHPSYSKKKTYEVIVRGDAASAVPMLGGPMKIDSHPIRAASVGLKKKTGDGGVLLISRSEGRNRQIRKMCAQCNLEVLSLKRVAIGTVTLGPLKTGQWRYLTDEEVKALSTV